MNSRVVLIGCVTSRTKDIESPSDRSAYSCRDDQSSDKLSIIMSCKKIRASIRKALSCRVFAYKLIGKYINA